MSAHDPKDIVNARLNALFCREPANDPGRTWLSVGRMQPVGTDRKGPLDSALWLSRSWLSHSPRYRVAHRTVEYFR